MSERAIDPPPIGEPEWVAAIPDEGDRAAVRAVLARKRWRESSYTMTLTTSSACGIGTTAMADEPPSASIAPHCPLCGPVPGAGA